MKSGISDSICPATYRDKKRYSHKEDLTHLLGGLEVRSPASGLGGKDPCFFAFRNPLNFIFLYQGIKSPGKV